MILSIDTSITGCSVAILKNNKIDYLFQYCKNNHSEKILPMIKKLLIRNNLSLKKINVLSVTQGPGTFTGIRTGICIATGISIGTSIPIITFSTLDVLAEQAWRTKKIEKLVIAIKLNQKIVCWKKYIRNNDGTWKNNTNEIISTHQEIYNQISKLKSCWIRIGNGWENIHLNYNIKNIKYENITIPHAIDIINLSIIFLKNNHWPICKIIKPKYFI